MQKIKQIKFLRGPHVPRIVILFYPKIIARWVFAIVLKVDSNHKGTKWKISPAEHTARSVLRKSYVVVRNCTAGGAEWFWGAWGQGCSFFYWPWWTYHKEKYGFGLISGNAQAADKIFFQVDGSVKWACEHGITLTTVLCDPSSFRVPYWTVSKKGKWTISNLNFAECHVPFFLLAMNFFKNCSE